jgi:hypothetical protein
MVSPSEQLAIDLNGGCHLASSKKQSPDQRPTTSSTRKQCDGGGSLMKKATASRGGRRRRPTTSAEHRKAVTKQLLEDIYADDTASSLDTSTQTGVLVTRPKPMDFD